MAVRGGSVSVLLVGALLAAGVASAQQPSATTTTQMGTPETTTSTRVIHATVVSVNGNKVVGKDASGKATEYTIPDGFKFQFEGKDIGVADLKPGMHVSATVTTTTTTTPVTVTEIRKGKVLAVVGDDIIVRGPQGVRRFSNQDARNRNATIMRDGKQISLSDLHVGDVFTAVIVTDHPPTVVLGSRGEGLRQRRARAGPCARGRRRSGSGSSSGARGGACSGAGQEAAQDGEPRSAHRPDGRARARGRPGAVADSPFPSSVRRSPPAARSRHPGRGVPRFFRSATRVRSVATEPARLYAGGLDTPSTAARTGTRTRVFNSLTRCELLKARVLHGHHSHRGLIRIIGQGGSPGVRHAVIRFVALIPAGDPARASPSPAFGEKRSAQWKTFGGS